MEDPVIYQEVEPFRCPQCGALFADEMALDAHREQEHREEAATTARRPDTEPEKAAIVQERLAHGERPAEHRDESPRPTEPAP